MVTHTFIVGINRVLQDLEPSRRGIDIRRYRDAVVDQTSLVKRGDVWMRTDGQATYLEFESPKEFSSLSNHQLQSQKNNWPIRPTPLHLAKQFLGKSESTFANIFKLAYALNFLYCDFCKTPTEALEHLFEFH